ncbi:MAG TPA: transaldolase [Rhizomicrobium sp.]|nr:transaldolase [Rhizomicrobium sp.]
MNPLRQLEELGQSVWLDNLSRELLASGKLARLIADDGLSGITSNPSIFEKAIGHSTDYDEQIMRLSRTGATPPAILRALMISDIQDAANALRGPYGASHGADGFVSIEVSPQLAMDTDETIAEARALWRAIARDNVMIKVPATEPGLPAIATLISEGINVNITLLFSRQVYERVAEAYLEGLEMRQGDLSKIASVASFFVSRIDTMADGEIEAKLKSASGAEKPTLENLRGKVAIANARLAYQQYKTIFSGARWEKLAARGARPQRLLWASTSTKNKAYPELLYVENLLGRDTINTLPPETLDAFRDHGKPRLALEEDLDEARHTLDALEGAGISLEKITQALVADGVKKFTEAADKLLAAIAHKRTEFLSHATSEQD